MLMLASVYCIAIPLGIWPVIGCVLLFVVLWGCFWLSHRREVTFYFDPQDFLHYEQGGGRELPMSASTNTFGPHLKNYIDAVKLLVTVSAASIAFGRDITPPLVPKNGILIAKIFLAFSILYGVLFSVLLQFFYEQYAQDVRYYTRWRYSLIQALGFSTLVWFVGGYFVWAFNLG
jgi:hypothetical protein